MDNVDNLPTIYERLGDKNLELLVHNFYEFVINDHRINALFKNDITEIKAKQFAFLSQFLGGPQRYTQLHGHPRLRMRHIPHAITEEGVIAWLDCMAKAIDTLMIEEAFKKEIYERFPQAAVHMINTPS